MKPHHSSRSSRRQRCCGISLIECLVYIGAMAIVFGMGTAAFYQCMQNSAALRRNTTDISQALVIGELWRADLRSAQQPPRFDANEQTLHIPTTTAEVAYKFSEGQVFRRPTANAAWTAVRPRVQQSTMTAEKHSQFTAWRWELELKTKRQPAIVRPLFTFTAAATQP